MNDWEDLYKSKKYNIELYHALIRYSEHFDVPFPMFMIGETTDDIAKCIKNNQEYEPNPNLIY